MSQAIPHPSVVRILTPEEVATSRTLWWKECSWLEKCLFLTLEAEYAKRPPTNALEILE